MRSIIQEVEKLRNGRTGSINKRNSNRYRLLYTEADGSETAYYFAAPIYNFKTRRMLSLKFEIDDSLTRHIGSNSLVQLSDKAILKNDVGECIVYLGDYPINRSEDSVSYNSYTVYPTLNGIAVRVKSNGSLYDKIIVKVSAGNFNEKQNKKCFSLMASKFVPFVTFSSVGVLDRDDNIVSEAFVTANKLRDNEYELYLSSKTSGDILLEINLHEQKLFQDTTVESSNPKINNAFGTTAFIGKSADAGEMWLYTRPQQTILYDLYDKIICGVRFYAPMLNQSSISLSAHELSQRFCSFGSTWEKKKASADVSYPSNTVSGYYQIDLLDIFTSKSLFTPQIQGFVLKSQSKEGFAVLPTGDSLLNPQILEINYRR